MSKIILYKVPGKKAKYMSNIISTSMTVSKETLPETVPDFRRMSPMQLMELGYIEIVRCGLMTKYIPSRRYQEMCNPTFQPPIIVIKKALGRSQLSHEVFALLEAYVKEDET